MLSVENQFRREFDIPNLERIFSNTVSLSGASGIDNINQKSFRPQLSEQLQIINRKVLAGTYEFTSYKLKLVSKGPGKAPREIAIPTIRDRIVLRALCNFLRSRFAESLSSELPQFTIKNVKSEISTGVHDGFVKLDVENFYPSIKHAELRTRLQRRIRKSSAFGDLILDLIERALSTPSILRPGQPGLRKNVGVPQGLAISNVLADIYVSNIDRSLSAESDIAYFRFVDDILLICSEAKAPAWARRTSEKLRRIGLHTHSPDSLEGKSKVGQLSESFGYLGYEFAGGFITVRAGSTEKLNESLVSIFTSFKHSKRRKYPQSEEFLLWRLNLRITGCVFQKRSRGWLAYFSEITDESLLHRLDNYIQKLISRFGVQIRPKRFVRAFHELKHRRFETTYIPNFDRYDMTQKKALLSDFFGLQPVNWTDEQVEREFLRRIGKQVKDLLEDLSDFS